MEPKKPYSPPTFEKREQLLDVTQGFVPVATGALPRT
jgi:hypothetical protein